MPPEGKIADEQVKVVILGEEPGTQEVVFRRPFVGASGQLLERTINRLGLVRSEAYLDNALLCRPPGNDLDRFNAEIVSKQNEQIKAHNKGKKKHERLPKVLTPQEACRGHIEFAVDLAAQNNKIILALGKLAYWAVTNKRPKIATVRGSFGEFVRLPEVSAKNKALTEPSDTLDGLYGALPRIKVVASVNPAYALRAAPYRDVLYRDIERALRWHRGELVWEDPEPGLISHEPSATLVEDFLGQGRWFTWDLETTGEGELENKLRTVGIYSIERGQGIVIPWVSIDGTRGFAPGLTLASPGVPDETEAGRKGDWWWRSFENGYHYGEYEGARIAAALKRFFEDANKVKIGHYSNYFDWTVIERHLGRDVRFQGMIDQILLARVWNSDLPRSLYFIGTMLTDVPSWKASKDERVIARDPRSPRELAVYNHTDNAVVGITGPFLIKNAQAAKQWPVVEVDHHVEMICREMHVTGLYVHEETRAELEEETREKINKDAKIVADIAGAHFNPRSTKQLGELLYEQWKLPIPLLTDTGRPSTSEDAIRILLTTPGLLKDEQKTLIEALWRARGWQKDLSDVLLPMRRRSRGGIVYEDGVLRPDYGAHIPSTGRISAAGPNTQNWRKRLRKLIRPRPGHLFIISDYDQIELRLMCALAGVKGYLDVFAHDGDPHGMTALLVYTELFKEELRKSYAPDRWDYFLRTGVTLKMDKSKGDKPTKLYDALRRFAKTFVYAVLYGGGASTVYDNVSKATDDDGNLLFPNMTFQQVEASVNSWMRNAKEVPVWWNKIWRRVELDGFVEEPILGRRRHMPAFLRNEAVNHPIQGGAALIMSQGLIRLRNLPEFAPDFERGLGIVNQMHDAVTLEVEESRAEELAALVTETLTARYDHIPGIVFSTEATVALDWSESAWWGRGAWQKNLAKLSEAGVGLVGEPWSYAAETQWRMHKMLKERDVILRGRA